ncbi:MAG: hypothetical protein ACK4PR_06890, partial [Gammaproteobacteria bacterium]
MDSLSSKRKNKEESPERDVINNQVKKRKKDFADTTTPEQLFAILLQLNDLWLKRYNEIFHEKNLMPLSLDTISPLYEVQKANILPYGDALLQYEHGFTEYKPSKVRPAYYVLSWEPDIDVNAEQLAVLQILEAYSRHASREAGLTQPIFSFKDYQEKRISFDAVFIQPELEQDKVTGLQAVLLFDNCETTSLSYHLRFEWWFSKKDHYQKRDLQRLQESLQIAINVRDDECILHGERFIRPFKKDIITINYATPLVGYNWLNIKENFITTMNWFNKKHPHLKNETELNELSNPYKLLDKIDKTAFPSIQKVNITDYFTILPSYQTACFSQVQLPVLTADFWRSATIINDQKTGGMLLPSDYLAVSIKSPIPEEASNIAKLYAGYIGVTYPNNEKE